MSDNQGPARTDDQALNGNPGMPRWVKIFLITAATVLQQPKGNPRDTEINDYALPILIRDTLSAQSANIDMVSGATVTSDGYVQSLQAALDEAGM